MSKTLKTPQGSIVTDPSCWLGHSAFFTARFSEKWSRNTEDDSVFIDCDHHLFEHVIRYLRTGVLPIFYDSKKGHDFAQYHALLGEAEYFGIDRLSQWLRSKRYLDAVKIHYVSAVSSDHPKYSLSDPDGRPFVHEDSRFLEVTTNGHMSVDLTPITQQKSFFFCPSGKHGKSTEEHCRSCNSTGVNGGWRNEDVLKWSVVRREVVFDHSLCVDAFPDDGEPA